MSFKKIIVVASFLGMVACGSNNGGAQNESSIKGVSFEGSVTCPRLSGKGGPQTINVSVQVNFGKNWGASFISSCRSQIAQCCWTYQQKTAACGRILRENAPVGPLNPI